MTPSEVWRRVRSATSEYVRGVRVLAEVVTSITDIEVRIRESKLNM